MATLVNGSSVSTPGYKNGSAATCYNTISVSNVQTDVANNKTTFDWKLNVRANPSSGVRYAYKALGLWINGNSVFFSDKSSGYGSNIWWNGEQRGSGRAEVYHNDAGEATVNFTIRDMFNGNYSSARWANYKTYQSADHCHQGSATFTCPTIARKSTASFTNNFNIGSHIKISIARKNTSFTHKIRLAYGTTSNIIASGVGTEWTWETENYPQLYSQIPNDNRGTGTIVIQTYNGNTYVGENHYSFTANVVGSNPLFSADTLSYEDTNSTISAITGSNQKLFKGYSHLKVNMSSGGSARNYATLGTNAYAFSYTGNNSQYANGNSSFPLSKTFNNVSGNAFTVSLTDSRGNSVAHSKNIAEVYNYTPPRITTAYAKRINPEFMGENMTIVVEGTYDNWGYATKNSCKNFRYRYREIGGSWAEWTYPTGMTYANGKFSFEGNIPGSFNIQDTFEFQFYIADKLSDNYSSITKVDPAKATLYMDVDRNIIGLCGIPENPSDNCAYYKGRELGTANPYPVGSVYLSANTTDPGDIFGGTWELVDKEFAQKAEVISGSATYVNYQAVVIHNGHSIRMRVELTLKTTIGDEAVKLLDMSSWFGSKIGAHDLNYSYFNQVGGSDSGNSLVLYNFTNGAIIETIDTFTDNLNAGDIIIVDHIWLQKANDTSMLDNFCNKFYWKRTA